MTDLTAIYVDNLSNAFDQVSSYIAIGVTAAISAFVLRRSPVAADGNADAETPFGKIRRDAGQLLFLGVCFVAGTMAYYAGEKAMAIVAYLDPATLAATCSRASVATGPVGVRVAALILPIAFALPVVIRAIRGLRDYTDARKGLVIMAGLLSAPYVLLGRAFLGVCR